MRTIVIGILIDPGKSWPRDLAAISCVRSQRERERENSCRNRGLEENQFDGSPLVGVRLAIISEHAEEIIGCSGVPSKTLSLSLSGSA